MALYSPDGVFGWPGPAGGLGRLGGAVPFALASAAAVFQVANCASYRALASGYLPSTLLHSSVTNFRAGSLSKDGWEVHDCAGVPPQSLSIRPIGTCRFCCRWRPKKYSTAEKLFTLA